MKPGKLRLDVLLVERGLFPSREAARRAIMAGLVRHDGEIVDKPGTQVRPDDPFEVTEPPHQYVGRGGLKLEKAIRVFGLDLHGAVVVDVGASTGGFTDCALQNGAESVYAVDVGYGQLAWKLRKDPRVIVMERTNFRHVEVEEFNPQPNVAVMDVSFISTRLILPKLTEVVVNPGVIVSLVKPQFEAGREHVGKGGIVRDPQVHVNVLLGLLQFCRNLGLTCDGMDYSPVMGGDGNIEYLALWHIGQAPTDAHRMSPTVIGEIVQRAWLEHKGEVVQIQLPDLPDDLME